MTRDILQKEALKKKKKNLWSLKKNLCEGNKKVERIDPDSEF